MNSVIITGGLDVVAYRFLNLLNIDVLANKLEFDQYNHLTGNAVTMVDVERKDLTLKKYLENKKSMKIIAVGDGEVDIPMFKMADHSIAFNPINEEVEKNSSISIKEKNLEILVHVLNSLGVVN